jgi:uncharacterized membrane protein
LTQWRNVGLVVAVIGFVDALYLTAESLNTQIPLYCPSGGIVNCATVTSSTFSRFAGIPVAVLGATWFGLILLVFAINNESLNYALIPLWALAVVGDGYLIFIELFVVHAICPYCTLAHALGISLIIPAAKLVFAE